MHSVPSFHFQRQERDGKKLLLFYEILIDLLPGGVANRTPLLHLVLSCRDGGVDINLERLIQLPRGFLPSPQLSVLAAH